MDRAGDQGKEQPLLGCIAIVTGASSGIGAATCRHLAQAGAKVAMAARREHKLKVIQEEILAAGGIAVYVVTDVTNRGSVKAMVMEVESRLGPVDILVNNAGVFYFTLMKNIHEDEWEKQVDVNCKGVLNCIGAVLDGMVKRNKGHIVNMSSEAGRTGFACCAVYTGTKFFVEGVSQSMRQELATTGVKVTCIQPGDVRTEIFDASTDTEVFEKLDEIKAAKMLEAEDIARAVVYAVTQPPYVAVNEILIQPRETTMYAIHDTKVN